MGRAPCCDKSTVKRGPWSPEEDAKLKGYIEKHGTGGNWIALPRKIGLKRCGKSCRLRWLNYLRPNIKHGGFTEEEDITICSLFMSIGSRWSIIASKLPGRTDNDIKNYWNTRLRKKHFRNQEKELLETRQANVFMHKQDSMKRDQNGNFMIPTSQTSPYCILQHTNPNQESAEKRFSPETNTDISFWGRASYHHGGGVANMLVSSSTSLSSMGSGAESPLPSNQYNVDQESLLQGFENFTDELINDVSYSNTYGVDVVNHTSSAVSADRSYIRDDVSLMVYHPRVVSGDPFQGNHQKNTPLLDHEFFQDSSNFSFE